MKTTASTTQDVYTVTVGSVGTVYSGVDYDTALDTYDTYCDLSQNGGGRVLMEPVYLFDGDILLQSLEYSDDTTDNLDQE